jgi:hypothetical protein
VKNNAKMLAQVLGGIEEDYYEFAGAFSTKNVEELLEMALNN